jgi:hypothetical protein
VSQWLAVKHGDGRGHVIVPGSDSPTADCEDSIAPILGTYICCRTEGHPGRHMAQVAPDAVVAAWPGDHEPTVADLTAVPS